MVQYWFLGDKHEVKSVPHGNAKKNKIPFQRTRESTKDKLRAATTTVEPKRAYNQTKVAIGKTSDLPSAAAAPRDPMQAKNFRKISSKPSKSIQSDKSDNHNHCDPLFAVLLQCKEQQGDLNTAFVQEVRCAPEPEVVCATQQQLTDIGRFCCDPQHFTVLGVDPSFNVGKFCYTLTTYRHLMVVDKVTGKNPVMIGPVLFHMRKLESSYKLLASTMVNMNPNLSGLLSFGTDGELNIGKAFSDQFIFAAHMRCKKHLEDNIDSAMVRIGIPTKIRRQILLDVFGGREGDTQYFGLADAISASEFDDKLVLVEQKWAEYHPLGLTFAEWFRRNSVGVMKDSMLRPLREQCQLGSPPDFFYNNGNESMNKLYQKWCKESSGERQLDMSEATGEMRALVAQRQMDVEDAIFGVGPYKVIPEFQHLAVDPTVFRSMSKEQRLAVIKPFNKVTVTHLILTYHMPHSLHPLVFIQKIK